MDVDTKTSGITTVPASLREALDLLGVDAPPTLVDHVVRHDLILELVGMVISYRWKFAECEAALSEAWSTIDRLAGAPEPAPATERARRLGLDLDRWLGAGESRITRSVHLMLRLGFTTWAEVAARSPEDVLSLARSVVTPGYLPGGFGVKTRAACAMVMDELRLKHSWGPHCPRCGQEVPNG